MTSLRDQSTRTIKRRLWELSREGQALVQETMARAMEQEATEQAYDQLAHLARTGLALFSRLLPGEMVTPEWTEERDRFVARLQSVLTHEEKGNKQGRESQTEDDDLGSGERRTYV